jgi:phosphoribosylformimino-5-aminoimidazole carboxamide ribotide isomerase
MIAIPAIELLRGRCAHGGGATPAAVARTWAGLGFSRLHLSDLDGSRENAQCIRELLSADEADVQVASGTMPTHRVERLMDDGAAHVVLGGHALNDEGELEELLDTYPGAVMLSLVVRDRRVMAENSRRPAQRVQDVLEELESHALGGVLITVLDENGVRRPDLALLEDLAEQSAHPIIAAGGLAGMNELRALADRGLGGAVVGAALYSGALDARIVAEEFRA